MFSLPAGTKMFQFPAFASSLRMMPCLQHGGLSHSEIPASTAICASTGLIAACHVLHRLREPRHPPCALSILPVVSPFRMLTAGARKGTRRKREGGSIYIRLFDFCSTLNFSACINMSMNALLREGTGPSPSDRQANRRLRAYGVPYAKQQEREEGTRLRSFRPNLSSERRCSSRTFRYGYLVTT